MAAPKVTPLFSPAFSTILGATGVESLIRAVDRVLAESLCQYEAEDHPWGCGRDAVVGDLSSEREYCLKHFQEVAL